MPDLESNSSITEFKGLEKALEKLADTVDSIVGVWRDPKKQKKMLISGAEGQVEAEKILALGRINNEEAVAERMLNRIYGENIRQQKTIESAVEVAKKYLSENVSDEPVSEGWKSIWVNGVKDVDDEDLIEYWSKILAGEIAQPKSFSLRTLNLVKLMDKQDVEFFTNICRFHIKVPEPELLIYLRQRGYNHFYDVEFYERHGTTYQSMVHLQSIGLITINKSDSVHVKLADNTSSIRYFNQEIEIDFSYDANQINIGNVVLTACGKELINICGAKPLDDFIEFLKPIWGLYGNEIKSVKEI